MARLASMQRFTRFACGKTIGAWPTDGYNFSESRGVRDGKFIGLALDEDNQGDLTESRIKTWSGQVKQAFGI